MYHIFSMHVKFTFFFSFLCVGNTAMISIVVHVFFPIIFLSSFYQK